MPCRSRFWTGGLIAVIAALAFGAVPAGARGRHHRARAARACANANVPATAAADQAMRDAVICLVNLQRSSRRLPALRSSWLLDRSAQAWTNAMVATSNFWHGINFAARITAVGFRWRDAGENIATGFQTPNSVVRAWMASKDHCQNILDPDYTRVGTGLKRDPVGTFASGPSTWTQDFALPMLKSPPSRYTAPERGCPYPGG